MMDIEQDLDPDKNFFCNMNNTCQYYDNDQYNSNILANGKLSIIHFNSRSLYKNYGSIKEYLNSFNQLFSIIAISETWIKDEKGTQFEIEGYDFLCTNRQNKGGGGVAIYVQQNLKFKVIDYATEAVDNLLECLTLQITVEKKKDIIISCVYRSPDSSIDKFREWMEKNILNMGNKSIFLCGDYNIDILNPNNYRPIEDFINSMHSLGFFPLITRPSRITSSSASLIDNIFTNEIENAKISGLLINDITDHLPVFTVYDDFVVYERKVCTYYKRFNNSESIAIFKSRLMDEDWEEVFNKLDVNCAYRIFLSKFESLYNQTCPLKEYKLRVAKGKSPWLTKGLKNACIKKNLLYKEFLKQQTKAAEEKYKRYKNKLTSIIRSSKKEYYYKKLEENKNNIKGIWNLLNGIIRDGRKNFNPPNSFIIDGVETSNMDKVVERFNEFFINVGPELAKQIPNSQLDEGFVNKLIESNPHSLFLECVDEKEVLDTVKLLNNKTSTDYSGLDMSVVKQVIEGIVKPLTYICNLSFQTGTFPNKMKIAKVIPLYKDGEKNNFTNYRPVSLLPQFSKVLETLFNKRLDTFLEKHNILSESQYGFRAKRSTSCAIMEAIEEITSAIDCRKYAIGIFIDLKKAFDTINHNILLGKLEKYGIRGIVLDWINSYLEGRTQFVKLGSHCSTYRDIVCGVPQGSVLGPKLFILYINEMQKISKCLKFINFADDTTIIYSGEDIKQMEKVLNSEMDKLKNWFHLNKLSLNVNKTKIMSFHGKSAAKQLVAVTIDGVMVEQVHEIKFLGVIVDEALNWKSHVKYIQSKVAKSVAVLYKAKYNLHNTSLRTLYCCLVLPYLQYCAEIWGNTYKSTLHSLYLLQKRAVRIIHKVNYLEHTNPLFVRSRLLKLSDIVSYQTAIIMFKAKNGFLPRNIQQLFQNREYEDRLRGSYKFKVLYRRTILKSFCISIVGVKLWNNMGDELKQSLHIHQFKKSYKGILLNNYLEQEI